MTDAAAALLGGETAVGERSSGDKRPPGDERPPGPVEGSRLTRLDILVATGLIVLIVVVPAVLAIHAGAFSIPYADDWSYRKIAFDFYRTGSVQFTGWVSMTLVGLLAWAWPFIAIFGHHEWVLSFASSVLAAVAVVFAYLLSRLLLSVWWSVAAVAVMASFAGFLWNTSAFMTDIPAMAGITACLWLGITAFNRQGSSYWALVTASMVAGLFGFSIREFAVFAPVAVLAGLAYFERRRAVRLGAIGVVVLIGCGVLYEWSTHVSGYELRNPGPFTVKSLIVVPWLYFSTCLFISPAIILAAARARKRFGELSVMGGIGVAVVGVMLLLLGKGVFLGDFLTQQGILGGSLRGGRPDLLPGIVWGALELLAILAGALLVALVLATSNPALPKVATPPSRTSMARLTLWVFVVTSAPLVAIFAVFHFAEDRYVWPIALVSAILLLDWYTREVAGGDRAIDRPGPVVAALVLALLLLMNAVLTLNAYSYLVGVWDSGLAAVARGIPATKIDAGFQWVGTHATTRAYLTRTPHLNSTEGRYDAYFPRFVECAVVTQRPMHPKGMSLAEVRHYKEYGIFGSANLYLYVTSGSCGQTKSGG